MTFIVESGSGTPGANAYASVAFVTTYLTERNRQNENRWASSSLAQKQAAIIQATDYIEQRIAGRVLGSKANLLIAGRQASASLTLSVLPITGSTFTVGVRVYRMVDTLAQEGDILIGATLAETIDNMVSGVNLDPEDLDVTIEEHTQFNYDAYAVDQSPAIAIAARTEGESGNLIPFTTTIVGATITGAGFLVDGLDEAEQYLSFPRRNLYTDDGVAIVGVPLNVKKATAEYSVRARAAPLSPDPAVDERFMAVKAVRTKVGPIEESIEYADRPMLEPALKPYPPADALLEEYLAAGGGVIRG